MRSSAFYLQDFNLSEPVGILMAEALAGNTKTLPFDRITLQMSEL